MFGEEFLQVLPNELNVASFNLIGKEASLLCAVSTTNDVSIFDLDTCSRLAHFQSIREHPLLQYEDSGGYVVDTMWDEVTERLFILAGSSLGHLLLFHANLTTSTPAATFVNRETQGTGHRAVVRCALSIPTSGSEAARLLTAGEDGLVCQWAQDSVEGGASWFKLHNHKVPKPGTSEKGEARRQRRAAPY